VFTILKLVGPTAFLIDIPPNFGLILFNYMELVAYKGHFTSQDNPFVELFSDLDLDRNVPLQLSCHYT